MSHISKIQLYTWWQTPPQPGRQRKVYVVVGRFGGNDAAGYFRWYTVHLLQYGHEQPVEHKFSDMEELIATKKLIPLGN